MKKKSRTAPLWTYQDGFMWPKSVPEHEDYSEESGNAHVQIDVQRPTEDMVFRDIEKEEKGDTP